MSCGERGDGWPRPVAVELPGATAYFSDRRGGVSSGPFATLNLGLGSGDDPARVAENRRRLAAVAGVDAGRVRWLVQVHGGRVHRWRAGSCDAALRDDEADASVAEPPRADAHVADEPGVGLLVLTADCLPVALADGTTVAAVHAGWRGLAAGVIANAARQLGAGAVACIGPGIGPCCYRVGGEVAARFAGYDGAVRGDRLDLAVVCEQQLRAAGVREVRRLGGCTACERERFFSYRRDGAATGRQGVLVVKQRVRDGG